MSSYRTTITIPDSEWNAVENCIRDTRAYVARRNEEVDRIQREINEMREQYERQRKENERRVQSGISDMVNSYNHVLSQLVNQSVDNTRNMTNQFGGQIETLRSDIQNNRIRIDQATACVDSVANQLNDVFTLLVNQKNNNKDKVEIIVNEINSLMEQINVLDPQIFMPNDYMRLNNLLSNINVNLSSGNYQAAIMNSQNGVMDAGRLFMRLTLENDLYRTRIGEIQTHVASLRQRFGMLGSAADGAMEVEVGGQRYQYPYDIEQWSYGAFGTLRNQFEEGVRRLDNPMPARELDNLTSFFDQIEQNLDAIDRRAREELIASAHVEQAADTISDLLRRQGWHEDGNGGFAESDERRPYTLNFKNPSGENISIVVAPGANAEQPDFFTEVYSDNPSREERIKENVQSLLYTAGINVVGAEHRNDCQNNPDPETFLSNTLREAEEISRRRRGMQQTM